MIIDVFQTRVCKVCGRELPADRQHWYFDRGKPHNLTCRECCNETKRKQRDYRRNGEGRSEAQTQTGWGSNYTTNVTDFQPGIKKIGTRGFRRNPDVRLEMQGGRYVVQMCPDGQWWPATDVEVELWLRLETS